MFQCDIQLLVVEEWLEKLKFLEDTIEEVNNNHIIVVVQNSDSADDKNDTPKKMKTSVTM